MDQSRKKIIDRSVIHKISPPHLLNFISKFFVWKTLKNIEQKIQKLYDTLSIYLLQIKIKYFFYEINNFFVKK